MRAPLLTLPEFWLGLLLVLLVIVACTWLVERRSWLRRSVRPNAWPTPADPRDSLAAFYREHNNRSPNR